MTAGLHRRGRLAPTAALALLALVVLLFVVERVGGPSLWPGASYQATVTVPDAHGLVEESDVLVRGVEVGSVEDIEVLPEGTRLVLSVDEPAAPLGRDATVRVASKTLLEEPYVDLVPGRAGPILPSGSQLPATAVRPTVELDEALAPLAGGGGASQRSLLGSLERGLRSDRASERVSATVGELRRLVGEVRTLTEVLDGQEGTLAAGMADTRSVLAELADRDESVRQVVGGGEATLAAVAGRQARLDATLRELPPTLGTTRRTLGVTRPLLSDARPLVANLRRAAPDLGPALSDVGPVSADASRLLEKLPELERVGVPFLRRAEPVVRGLRPVARELAPTVANLVPILRYLAARRNGLSAFVAHIADATGPRAGREPANRVFVINERGTARGRRGNFENNAYTRPGDARNPRPFEPGSYPRLRPLFRP